MSKILLKLDEIITLLLPNKSLWTLKDFCKYADISIEYGYHLTSTGKINFYRPFGKKIYIDRDDAITLLKSNGVNSNGTIEKTAMSNLLKNK